MNTLLSDRYLRGRAAGMEEIEDIEDVMATPYLISTRSTSGHENFLALGSSGCLRVYVLEGITG